MNVDSKLSRVVLVSPWFLLIFLVIPVLVILSIALHVQLPLAGPDSLLVNNICFAFLTAFRLLRYLVMMGKQIRYGAEFRRPLKGAVTLSRPVAEVRRDLGNTGYIFSPGGAYGEKRDLGYLGTTILYGGLLLLLSVGSWDNLRKFSAVLYDGMGPSTDLSRLESYRTRSRGRLAAKPDSLPHMQITKQYLPDSTYPMGATEVNLYSADGKVQRHLLIPRNPVRYGDYEIYMEKLVFESQIVIKTRGNITLFDDIVKLDQLVKKRGDFSFYGHYVGNDLVGGVYYQPEKSLLMVVITRNGKRVVTDLQFQVDQQVEQGEYILSCAKMGQWSEIHVVRRRNTAMLWFGGILVVAGLLLRIAVRPQRVWLEETAEGSRVWGVGVNRLKAEG